ncbi:MAG: hypothetical protein LBC41_04915 [Clostridiales bacterium]|nr:hypothetical protein [Clostridiales bacterium]
MKRKLVSAAAALMATALLIAGTFAWTNFNQSAVNEWSGEGTNPGGTLHDDFNNPDKDVYIENWGKEPLIVRIRLDEYMELGEGAGLKSLESDADGRAIPNPDNKAVSLLVRGSVPEPDYEPGSPLGNSMSLDPHYTATINTKEYWLPFVSASASPFAEYWEWVGGGKKYYFPADPSKRGALNYVAQDPDPVKAGDVRDGIEAKETLDAEFITADEWSALGRPLGNYWILDTTGWIYWADALNPDTATGLLLTSVKLKNEPTEDYYYAINVVTQMATVDGVNPDGTDNNYKLFYQGEYGTTLAMDLTNRIADKIKTAKAGSGDSE